MMRLATPARVEGPRLVLRLCRPDDANYIHSLRTNPDYNRYLSEVRGTADDQRRWIEAYKVREAAGRELYYVIERRDGASCGVVRLYEIARRNFTWGSWILERNRPHMGALESAVLSFGIGFTWLGCERAVVEARAANTHAIAFYRRFGMIEVDRRESDIRFVYTRQQYEADRDRFEQILVGEDRVLELQP